MKRATSTLTLLLLFSFTSIIFSQNISEFNHFPQTPSGELKAWIFFKDKGVEQPDLAKATELLSQRTIHRRELRRPDKPLVEYSDLPVYDDYLQQIKPYVHKIRVVSRWLNGVSVEASAQNLSTIQSFDFVLKIDPIAIGKPRPKPRVRSIPKRMPKASGAADSLAYGPSLKQLEQIHVPFLHKKGLYGSGVVICMLDDGVNLLYSHEALKRVKIIATHDFIHDDDAIDDSGIKAYEGWHGTMTLSVIAGYTPETLIGPAFDASFLLAKTEVDQFERPIEEDYWVAGIEWGEQNGADIVSSSLGYIDWYTPNDMNGETAKTTIAADMAVEKGVLVFNSAGNEGDNLDHNTLIAPADGKKVLAVAAVDRNGLRASFSSVGPTADGRIKPDIAAMGQSVIVANSKDSAGYAYGSGTSFSCPLAAGGAALLLEAFPTATPELMAKALKSTASQANFPDKYLGWGIIDLQKAYAYLDTATAKEEPVISHLEFYPVIHNPGNEYVEFSYQIKYPSAVEIRIYNMIGQQLKSMGVNLREAEHVYKERLDTRALASGTYIVRVAIRELGTGHIFRKSQKFVVLH